MQIDMKGLDGGARSGAMPIGDVESLQKALEAGYGTDMAALTGGGALRIQSLDRTMQSTIQENQHFKLFNRMPKPKAGATVDEWTEQSSVGGHLGGSTNTETGNIPESTGVYNRRVGMVKYLMTRRQVSFVQTLQNAIADSEAVEYTNGALQLLTDAEFLSFEGEEDAVPTEFDGIYAQIRKGIASGQVDGDNILDAEGNNLASVDLVNRAAAHISAYGNFGTPTDLFMSQLTQADFDTDLDPAFRVPLTDVPNGGIALGSPVTGIRTSWGNIKANPDVFIRDGVQQLPFEIAFPSLAALNTYAPASVTAAMASDVESKFGAIHDGNYYYYVTGVTARGESVGTKTTQTAVAAGQKVTLTITASVGGQETGYVIYRSRKNGTNATNDFRFVTRIAKAGATTPFVDLNREIPGTSKAYILNLAPSATAITWRQLLPMLKFPLYPTVSAIIPWAQMLFGYLRISKRRHHVVIKNVLPRGATWRPFG